MELEVNRIMDLLDMYPELVSCRDNVSRIVKDYLLRPQMTAFTRTTNANGNWYDVGSIQELHAEVSILDMANSNDLEHKTDTPDELSTGPSSYDGQDVDDPPTSLARPSSFTHEQNANQDEKLAGAARPRKTRGVKSEKMGIALRRIFAPRSKNTRII